ncbi:MAG: response regulator transcription factor [Clostridiales bacterium]|nr:response regulator transcription factor [Clostridiales bacterium]
MSNQGYLLLVEDEPLVQANNKRILERRGYATRQAYTLAEARAIIAEDAPGAIVLDILLPDGNGLDFLRELRQNSNIPVLMLTSMGTPQDIIHGLEIGGDDYMTKPYELPVFIMRIQALLRRAAMIPETLRVGPIRIDTASSKAYYNDGDMGLSPKESFLLQQFIQNPDKILSAEYLYEKVWGEKMAGEDNTLKVAISKLRTKLTDSDYTITASRGEGYYFEMI